MINNRLYGLQVLKIILLGSIGYIMSLTSQITVNAFFVWMFVKIELLISHHKLNMTGIHDGTSNDVK